MDGLDRQGPNGVSKQVAAKVDKRKQERHTPDGTFTVHHRGERCRVVDVSETGLGISYITREDWPRQITLECPSDTGSTRKVLIKCRTVWESSMDFYRIRSDETVKRRGLEFIEPDSRGVEELHRQLKRMV